MPLKIRCPHCQRVLVADDEVAGEQKVCPACGQVFNVPLPSGVPGLTRAPTAAEAGRTCPRCGTEVAPTAGHCHKCHTDLRTGERLPLKRRLRLFSWRFRAIAGFTLAGTALVVLIALQLYLIRSRRAETTFTPTTPRAIPAAEFAKQLLGAKSPVQRRAAFDNLSGVELRATPAVAAALAASLEQRVADPQARWNRIAAIDLLALYGQAHPGDVPGWLELLERCQQDAALYSAALHARAMLGDARVLDELAALWLEQLQRLLLLKRVVRVSRAEDQPAAGLVLRRAAAELRRCADGLRALARDDENLVFERLAEAYWESWNWLGGGRGDRLADELFDLAKPEEQTLEFKPQDVRRPRDTMKRVAARGSPAARAAAGLILKERGPQYKSLCRRIGDTLAELLPECTPVDQQRLTWAIARLRGKLFGTASRSSPLDMTEPEIAAALVWAHPGAKPALKPPYPRPPVLTCRAVTVARLLERNLLREMQAGWTSAGAALDTWLAADLGCTPRVRELLNPGQRRPDYPALTAAMIIAAESNDRSCRPQLELWHEATDQPAWVRALAYTVLGSLDARRGRWESGWPAGLDLGDIGLLDSGEPGWSHFGHVLAAGGPRMLRRLADFRPAPLSGDVRSKLMDAAHSAVGRPGPADVP